MIDPYKSTSYEVAEFRDHGLGEMVKGLQARVYPKLGEGSGKGVWMSKWMTLPCEIVLHMADLGAKMMSALHLFHES